MRLTRLVTLSMIYNYREVLHGEGFNTDPDLKASLPLVRVITKDQAYDFLKPECVVIYPSNDSEKELQIGGGFWNNFFYNFDIYASTEARLSDIVDVTRKFLQTDSKLYRYDIGTPTYQVLNGLVRSVYIGDAAPPVTDLHFRSRSTVYSDRVRTIGESQAHTAQVSVNVSTPSM